MTFLNLHLLIAQTLGFFFAMDEMGNVLNISGDIWSKNERDVKQTSCTVVCYDAVSIAPTVYTGYIYIYIYVCVCGYM